MNSTSTIKSMLTIKNSTTTFVESWFIPVDILMIICCVLTIILATLFLLIIIFDKTCRTISMISVANSCLMAFILGSVFLSFAIFSLQNDLQQIQYQDSLCFLRTYISYTSYTLFNCSFVLQALYRYLLVIYPNRLFWQSARFQLLAICFKWIYALLYTIPYILIGGLVYNIDNQICQLPLRVSFLIIYGASFCYLIPISLIVFMYWKLVRYVKEMSKRVTPVKTLNRAERELKMVQRIVILVTILIAVCFPYTIITLMAFFNHGPKYHFRIAYVSVDASALFVLIALFMFTDPLKRFLMKIINIRPNTVIAVVT
jgi:hypothetical protein